MKKVIVLILSLILMTSLAYAAFGPGDAPAASSGSSSSSSSSSSSGGGGGGGGGGSGGYKTYTLSEAQIADGATRMLKETDRVKFPIDGINYVVVMETISSSAVTINMSGDANIISLGVSKKLELTGDSLYDVMITYDSYDVNATMTFKEISETITVEAAEEVAEEVIQETVDEVPSNELTGAVVAEDTLSEVAWLWVVLALAVAVIIGAVAYILVERK